MLTAAIIEKCTDPSLTPAIVEQFVAAAGSTDPLAVTVKSGGRLILVPKAKSPEEAMGLIRQYVGQAVVRVGLTQFPAGVGIKDASELKPDLVDACENLRVGTKMFARFFASSPNGMAIPPAAKCFRKYSRMPSTPGRLVSSKAWACFRRTIRAVPSLNPSLKSLRVTLQFPINRLIPILPLPHPI